MNHHLPLRNKLIIMGSVMASLFLVALDQTIISTALGKIIEEFNAFESLSWIVTAYMLTTTITVPIAGKLSDLYGRRIMLLIGVAIFGVGSLMSGLAGSVDQLVLWRALQGVGGGIITANAFTIVGDLFVARERGKWQGLMGAVFGLSSIIGPVLGGWLTDGHSLFGTTTDWRWAFYINVPVAIVAFLLILIFCPTLRRAAKPRVDYRGAALLTVGLATLVLSVDNTESIFTDVMQSTGLDLFGLRIIMAIIVAISLTWFVYIEKRAEQPIVPLGLFKSRNFSLVMGVAMLFGAGFMGSILYLTQFNQQVFHATPTESGLMLLPMVAGIMTASISSGQIISRTGRYKLFMQIGIVLAAVMLGLLATLQPESSYVYEAVLMALLGLGLGMVMPVMTIVVQNEFKQSELGVATSSVQLFRGLGSTIGVAIFGALLTGGMAAHVSDLANTNYVKSLSASPAAQQIGSFDNESTLLTINTNSIRQKITDGFDSSTRQLPAPVREQAKKKFLADQDEYSNLAVHAFSDSIRSIFLTSAMLLAVASFLVFFIEEKELKSSKIGPVISEG